MSVIKGEVHFDLQKVYSCPCYFNAIVLPKKKDLTFSVEVQHFIRKKINSNVYLMSSRSKTLFACISHHASQISCLEKEIVCDYNMGVGLAFIAIVSHDTMYRLCQNCFVRTCFKQLSYLTCIYFQMPIYNVLYILNSS